jgi:hypothetical protein
VAASTSSGRGHSHRVVVQRAGRGTESGRQVGDNGMVGVGGSVGWSGRDGPGGRGAGGDDRRDNGEAFERVVRMECNGVVGGGSSSAVGGMEGEGNSDMLGDKSVLVMASKAIDVAHHTRRSMKDLKEVDQELLGPSTDLVDRAVVLQNCLDCTAVAEPKEIRTPKKFPILTDGPNDRSQLRRQRNGNGTHAPCSRESRTDWGEGKRHSW